MSLPNMTDDELNEYRNFDEHLAELEAILHKMETESDILNEDFLDMKDYLNTVIKDNETFRKELKELSLEPLTYDGENNDEVDSFTAGYNAALEDMRDIIQKYVPT